MLKPYSFLLLLVPGFLFSQTKVSVITQHNDLYRTGWNNKETILNHSNVASSKFTCIGTLAVDDEVYAQPLLLQQATIGSYTGSVLYVATVNNSIYAFNADDVSSAAALWHVNLNPAGQRAPAIEDLKDPQRGRPCGGNYRDFSGRFGIVGTPVIDTLSKTLFVSTKTIDNNGQFYAYINAIDIRTGQHRPGSPKLITAQSNGNGDGSVNGIIRYDAKYQNQRPALLLYNNTIYVASASYCDWGPYHGWILGYDAATLNLSYSFNATPNGWAGGIWMAGQGISVGDDGNLYVVTGNGTTGADNNNMLGGRSESLIKLTPQLTMLDWFTPSNYEYLDIVDLDYGSDGVLIVPNSSTTVSGSKEGISYVVDYNNMGRLKPNNSQVKDTLEFNPARVGYVHVHGSPVYAKLSTGEFVYAWAESFKIRQFTYDRSNGIFSNSFKQGNRNLDYGMPGAMLSLSSNNDDTASAIVWACFPTSGNANNQVRPGSIAAYRANDVSAGELWSSDIHRRDSLGNFAKFNSPTIANGKVFVPTFSNAVKVYGIGCNGSLDNIEYDNGTGLKGEYFTNSNSSSGYPNAANFVRLDNNVNFNWGTGNAAEGISNDIFKVRWTGSIKSPTSDNYTIYITASDGVRLWINNAMLMDSWSDKNTTTHSANIFLEKGREYDIRIEYYSNAASSSCILQWSAPGICKQVIPSFQLFAKSVNCNSNGSGLLAEYYSNVQPAAPFPINPTITKLEPQVNFNWGGASPQGISNDLFKAVFKGYVQSLDSGSYTFYLTADDGVRLWINNQLLIDKWIDQAATEYAVTVTLPKCTRNSIRIEFYENGGDAVCRLEWRGPLFARQVVPAFRLFTEADPSAGNDDFIIYPNPNRIQNLTVQLRNGFQLGDELVLYDILGRKLNQVRISSTSQGSTWQLPLRLPAGVYTLRLLSGGKTFSKKFVVL